MVEKDKLVELMQKYLQATKELYDYTTSEDLYVPTPCGFTSADDPIHMYCTPETYSSLAKLFDPGSSHVKPSTGESPIMSSQLSGVSLSRFSGLLMNMRRCVNSGCCKVY